MRQTSLSLYHFRARIYDAVSGRFLSRDPIGYNGSPWCLYEYNNGGGLHLLDPSGLAPVNCQDEYDDCIRDNDWRDENCELNAHGFCFVVCTVRTRKCGNLSKFVLTPLCFVPCLETYLWACRKDSRIGANCCAAAKAKCDNTGNWPGFLWRLTGGCPMESAS